MPKRVPSYCRQRESGRPDRAFCRINGKKILLGEWQSKESKAKYAELISENAGGGSPAEEQPATMTDLMGGYLEHAESYYGTKGPEWYHIKNVIRDLRERYVNMPAMDFRAKRLQETRKIWIEKGWSRCYINDQMGRIKRMFKWAAEREMVPPDTYLSLRIVSGLRRGKTEARDTDPIEPVSDATIEATLPFLPELIAVAVQVQRLCGCRPGELIRMRKRDIDRSGEVWVCRLRDHKTAHRGKKREIYFGPKAQELLLPRLICSDEDRLFPFRRDSFRRAIHRACKRAGIPNWCPLQIRHLAGTRAREVGGLEGAQVHLGHSRCDVTQVYAETSRERAIQLAKKIG